MGELTGRCLCGAIRYAADEAHILWRSHCHCESCRRQTSSPFTTWFSVRNGHWRWLGEAPASYASSPGVLRRFCATCGTPMAFQSEKYPDATDFYAASLDNPTSFRPDFHTHWQEHLPWIDLNDGLPRHFAEGPDESD